ncbi:MAG: cytochrome C oxidase subunit IV family protein [Longimicrobiales bacterium]
MESHSTVAGHATGHRKAPNYYLIWAILLVLTLAEVGVAFVSAIPKRILIIVLVAMAIWKAVLVAMYYMHLKFEPRKLWFIALAPVPLAIILVMVVLSEGWGG